MLAVSQLILKLSIKNQNSKIHMEARSQKNIIHKILCTIKEFLEVAQMQQWLFQLVITLILYLMTAKKEPKQKLKPELLQLKNFSLEMLEPQNLFKEDKILIFKQINLLRS